MIESLFATGHAADLVLIVMVVEAVILFLLVQRGKIQLPYRTYISGVIAGGLIIFALRQALTGGSYVGIAIALALSFVAHLAELLSFVQRNKSNPNSVDSSYQMRSKPRTVSKKGLSQ